MSSKALNNMTQNELEMLIQKIVMDKLIEWMPVVQSHPLTDEEWEMFENVIPSTPATRPTLLLQQERDQWYKPTS